MKQKNMNDLVIYILFVVTALIAIVINFFVAQGAAKGAAEIAVNEKYRDKDIRTPMDEEKASNLNEELRKNHHNRIKDFFVMGAIAGLITTGLCFLWSSGSEGNHSDAKGWAVGALDTLLGVVVGYGFSKNDSTK